MLQYIEAKSVVSLYLPFVALQQLCEVAAVRPSARISSVACACAHI